MNAEEPFFNWRCPGLAAPYALYCFYLYLGRNCGCFCKQGNTEIIVEHDVRFKEKIATRKEEQIILLSEASVNETQNVVKSQKRYTWIVTQNYAWKWLVCFLSKNLWHRFLLYIVLVPL